MSFVGVSCSLEARLPCAGAGIVHLSHLPYTHGACLPCAGASVDLFLAAFFACHVCLAQVTGTPAVSLARRDPSSVPPNALSNGILPSPPTLSDHPHSGVGLPCAATRPPTALHMTALRACVPLGSVDACALSQVSHSRPKTKTCSGSCQPGCVWPTHPDPVNFLHLVGTKCNMCPPHVCSLREW